VSFQQMVAKFVIFSGPYMTLTGDTRRNRLIMFSPVLKFIGRIAFWDKVILIPILIDNVSVFDFP
jgi:hypothetical protein